MINNSVENRLAAVTPTVKNDRADRAWVAGDNRLNATSNPGHEGSNVSSAQVQKSGGCPGHSMAQNLVSQLC